MDSVNTMSRRKLLASMGIAGVAVATGTLMGKDYGMAKGDGVSNNVYGPGGNDGPPFWKRSIPQITIEELRDILALTSPDFVYYITDPGQEGAYRYNQNDTSSADNTGTIIVSASGARWQRIYEGGINVKWFGAKGDGLTDDTIPIQQAIDCTSHQTVYIPEGIFMTKLVNLKSHLALTGVGTLKRYITSQSVSLLNIVACENVVVRDLTLDVNDLLAYPLVTARNGVNIRSTCNHVHLSNLKIYRAGRDGIYINETGATTGDVPQNIHVEQCTIDQTTRNGISVICGRYIIISECRITDSGLLEVDIEPNDNSTLVKDITVQNCWIKQTERAKSVCLNVGIAGAKTESEANYGNITFDGNTCIGNGRFTVISVKRIQNCKIINNTVENYVSGISANGNSTISNNILRNSSTVPTTNTSGAIIVWGNCTVTSNIINDCGSHGIVLYYSNKTVASGNVIKNIGKVSQAFGIYVLKGNNNVVSSNIVYDDQPTPTTYRGITVSNNETQGLDNIISDNICLNAIQSNFAIGAIARQVVVGNSDSRATSLQFVAAPKSDIDAAAADELVRLSQVNTRSGGVQYSYRKATGNLALQSTDFHIDADATLGNIVITLPSAASGVCSVYSITKTDSTIHTVTLQCSGTNTILGNSTEVINTQGQNVQLMSNGTNGYTKL